MSICIMDIPKGVEVEVVMGDDTIFKGKVVKNYGGSLVMDCGAELFLLVPAMEAKAIKIEGKESVDSYRASISKREEK